VFRYLFSLLVHEMKPHMLKPERLYFEGLAPEIGFHVRIHPKLIGIVSKSIAC
jgi:hypothetical protein